MRWPWSRWEEEGRHGLLFVGRRGALACALGTVVSPGSWPEISAGLLRRGRDEAAMRAQLVSGGARCERAGCAGRRVRSASRWTLRERKRPGPGRFGLMGGVGCLQGRERGVRVGLRRGFGPGFGFTDPNLFSFSNSISYHFSISKSNKV